MQNIFDLSDRVSVVMGGTSGIGRAIATGLAAHGASVVPTGRRVEKINEVCCEIEKMGRRTLRCRRCECQVMTNLRIRSGLFGSSTFWRAPGCTFQ